MAANNSKLQVANRASFWLQSWNGRSDYSPNQFLHFTAENNPKEMQQLYDGFTWIYSKLIQHIDTPKPYPYLFIQSVVNGKAGALYTDCLFVYDSQGNLINPRGLAALQGNIIATIQRWCSEHSQTMNSPIFQQDLPDTGYPNDTDQTLVVTVDLK